MTNKNHPFHLVENRPWPIIISFNIINSAIRIITWIHFNEINILTLRTITLIINSYQWWRDVTRERTFQGLHTKKVTSNLKIGIILFILSEIIFFISFFWRFFHRRLSPNIEIGIKWPPEGILTFNPISTPLLNTVILLSSGASITWTHHRIIKNNFNQSTQSLIITIILGIYFSLLQIFEYIESKFSISDSIYGSTFFIATGFHGIHVIIGTTFLLISLTRLINIHFSKNHHFGFEAAAWYWHFVDVVWLFLYLSIYWWGNYSYSIKIIIDFQSGDLKSVWIIPLIILIIIILTTSIILLSNLLSKKKINDREKISPFECGFDPKSSARIPFSIHFFIIAILFLIFDIEITIILPFIKISILKISSIRIILTSIIIIIMIGLLHEWKQGILNWKI